MISGMLRPFLVFMFVSAALAVSAQFKNKKLALGTPETSTSKPTVAINPRDPLNAVIVSSGNISVTRDGGSTWEQKKLPSPIGSNGDPAIVADTKGNFYLIHLSDSSDKAPVDESRKHIVCNISADGGHTWDMGSTVLYNPLKDQRFPSVTTDGKGNVYVAWTQFDKYGSKDSTCQSQVLLSSSSNGKKWAKPTVISQVPGDCVGGDNSAAGAMAAVSEDKKLYVSWSNNNLLFIDRSFNNGDMWLSNDIVIGRQPGGWDVPVPGHRRANGLPVLLIEKLKGGRQGMLYMSWADQRNGDSDTDIWFVRSANFGDNWTAPIKVNDDGKGKHQYLPSMAIDQTTGYLYVLYYDRRNSGDDQTEVYLAYSTDSGSSFTNVRISDAPFLPVDFTGGLSIAAHKGIIIPVWYRMDNDAASIWTATIRQNDLIKPSPASTK